MSFGHSKRSGYHAWVPQTNVTHDNFVQDLLKEARRQRRNAHIEPVVKFSQSLTDDQKALFEQALLQVGEYYAKWADPTTIITSFEEFLEVLDVIVVSAPRFYKSNVRGVTIGEPIGVPLTLFLDLVSNTSAAYTLFTQESFNAAIRDLLNSWGEYLKREASSNTLAGEWFSPEGLAVLEAGLGKLTFDETFKSELPAPKRYKSWDSFFIRELKDGVRPVQPTVDVPFLYNACESTAFRTARDVQLHDTFWLKTQNYSLYDIFDIKKDKSYEPYAKRLLGGSVYQAFLSPADYHRWHSPIKGNILASKVINGTYYAVLPDDGAPPYDPDLMPGDPHGGLIRSQPWFAAAATRAVYIIEGDADSPVDLIAFVAIGMVEVSTCDITKPSGAVNVGDQIGMFHFGGSTHALIVKPKAQYDLVFQDFYDTPIRPGQHRAINSVIGQFWPKSD